MKNKTKGIYKQQYQQQKKELNSKAHVIFEKKVESITYDLTSHFISYIQFKINAISFLYI
jgi:hypothetical protein